MVDTSKPLFAEIMHRRVPHFFGAYIITIVGLLQGVSWFQGLYLLSPRVNHLAVVFFLALIPTNLILAWEHGAPGKQERTRLQQFGLPLNFLLAILLVWWQHQPGDFGKMTQTVTVQNEAGVAQKREIPKANYRSKFALFSLKNETGDPELDWLGYGIPALIHFGQFQDPFTTPFSWLFNSTSFWRAESAGLTGADQLPLPLLFQIARDGAMPHFMTGSYTLTGELYAANIDIYQSDSGKKMSTFKLQDKDVLLLVDKITARVKKELNIPEVQLGNPILPVKEITSAHLEAQSHLWEGLSIVATTGDFSQTITRLKKATELDPNFALAQLQCYVFAMLNNQSELATENLRAAYKHQYKLPETFKYLTKYSYYFHLEKDVALANKVLQTWVQLYPDDILGHQSLLRAYILDNEQEKAIATAQKIVVLDPSNRDSLLALGSLYQSVNQFDNAEQVYLDYAAKFPDSPDGHTVLGDFYALQGAFEKAITAYDKALSIDSGRFLLILKKAQVAVKIGRFTEALEAYDQAAINATNPSHKTQISDGLVKYYRLRGQLELALTHGKEQVETAGERSRAEELSAQLSLITLMAEAGDMAGANQLLDHLRQELKPPFSHLTHQAEVKLAAMLKDTERLSRHLAEFDEIVERYKFEGLLGYFHHVGMGLLHEVNREFDKALEAYGKLREIMPLNEKVYRLIAGCHRSLGNLELAEENISRALQLHPHQPKSHHLAALIHQQQGKNSEAHQHLNKALEIWADADETYAPAQEARRTQASWETGF